MKSQLFPKTFLLFVLGFIGCAYAQTIIPAGDVSGTWTLTGSPYLIQGEINIPNDSTLSIEPGVIVEFQGHYQFNVQGRLLAVGTETDTIVFTINDTTGFHNPNIPDGGWFGIRFEFTPSTNDSSKIVYCKLQYGKAIGTWPDNHGGAIWVWYFDKLIISNCIITDNIAWGGVWPSGGGIALHGSSPKITGNTISHNSAVNGGGIHCYNQSSPHVLNNFIVNNSADNGGGGIVCDEYSNPILNSTIIDSNIALYGAGIACWNNSSPSLENVTISNNLSHIGSGIHSFNSNLQIENSSFINNEALFPPGRALFYECEDTITASYQLDLTNTVLTNNTGGGIFAVCWDSARVNIFIEKCEFTNNLANGSSGLFLAGDYLDFTLSNSIITGNEAISYSGGACFERNCKGTVSNCLFASNVAATGGGTWYSGGVAVWEGANVDFMNCTFADNSASYGAGLTVGEGGMATTTNCIFWGNSTNQIALDSLYGQGGTLTVNYCDVQDGKDSVNVDPLCILNWGSGNIDADPIFADPLTSDYHLKDSSPCIGAAIDSIEINGIMCYCPATDIEGNPRPNPSGSMPDMGAYESSLGSSVGIEVQSSGELPQLYSLSQNYPNPFNPTTNIRFRIADRGFVSLKVYDVAGREVTTLVAENLIPGSYEYTWDARGLASGVYFYRIEAGNFTKSRKMLLIR
jgi:hypothetical protein